MARRMTGFGSARRSARGLAVDVEVRSVNPRYLPGKSRLAGMWSGFAPEIEQEVRRHLERGSVYVTIGARSLAPERELHLHLRLAKRYVALLGEMKRKLRLDGDLDVEKVASLPGVFGAGDADLGEAERRFEAARAALVEALRRLVAMREREGKALVRDLDRRCASMENRVATVSDRAPSVVAEYRDRLRRRMGELLAGTEARLRDEDLARE